VIYCYVCASVCLYVYHIPGCLKRGICIATTEPISAKYYINIFQSVCVAPFNFVRQRLGNAFMYLMPDTNTSSNRRIVERIFSTYVVHYQQLKKKSLATALNTVLASAHIQMI
jgi:hypothetical protein